MCNAQFAMRNSPCAIRDAHNAIRNAPCARRHAQGAMCTVRSRGRLVTAGWRGGWRSMLITNIGELVTNASGRPGELGLIGDAAVAVADGAIQWAGPQDDLPGRYRHAETLDAAGGAVLP